LGSAMALVSRRNPLRLEAVENGVRELRNDRAPNFTMNLCKHLRIAFYGIKG